ncbi:MAG: hybrid sensor histidine kinase/response regulator [Anaerolineae bacterium]|nr:hybrid sensor histidine kinase/response regulator [Anaerolineae bacterium]
MPQASILVVDDTRANLRFLAEVLSQQGYAVRPVLNGAMALASVEAKTPDLILLDIMMPDMDGYEVCARFKADPDTADIPIIFLSALNEVADKVRAFAVGGVDYITKPFQVEEVLARVATHLALRDLQKRLEEQNACLEEEIVERKRAEAILRQYACNLEASNAELDAFAHTVAHDLKTPVTALLGFSTLLERRFDQLPEDVVRERLHLITQTGHKMTDIINELLLLASVRKMDEIECGPLDMADIVTEARGRLSEMIERTQATLVLPESWPVVHGYAPWVEEVWVNYLSNALKYGGKPATGAPPHIALGWARPGEPEPSSQNSPIPSHVRFWVRDNGPGIALLDQNRLFVEFQRLQQTRVQGHGLGLSIVRRIVEKLQGAVGVESVEDQGSLFWFTLPSPPGV